MFHTRDATRLQAESGEVQGNVKVNPNPDKPELKIVIQSNFRRPLFFVQSRLQYNDPSDKIFIQFDGRDNGSNNLGVKVGIK